MKKLLPDALLLLGAGSLTYGAWLAWPPAGYLVAGVMLLGADLDESPMAYRRLPDVLAHHAGSVKVLHTLRPFAVAMAGSGEFDPFRD